MNTEKVVFVEGEGRRIGDLIIPETLWKKFMKGKNILITGSLNQRANVAVEEYLKDEENIIKIKEIALSLRQLISKENKEKIAKSIDNQDYHTAAKILLEFYYDPLYSHTLKQKTFDAEINSDDIEHAVKELKKLL